MALDRVRVGFLSYSSRSGSTFLAARIAERYAVTVVPEIQCGYWLLRQQPDKSLDPAALREALERDRQLTWVTAAEIADLTAQPRRPADVLIWIAQRWAADRQLDETGHVLFKLGAILGFWDAARRVFPEARAIAVVRDGRAVANSLLHTPRAYGAPGTMGRGDAIFCAKRWIRDVSEQRRAALDAPTRVRIVRYEDVITSTDATLADLAEWAGWRAGGIGGFTVADAERHMHALVQGAGVDARITGWEAELSSHDRLVVEQVAKDALIANGYSDFLSATPGQRRRRMARAYARHAGTTVADGARRLRQVDSVSELRSKASHRLRRR